MRRNVSPSGSGGNAGPGIRPPIQIVEVSFPPKARVAYETGAREPQIHQQVWGLEGSIDVTVGDDPIGCAPVTAWRWCWTDL